jgi:hypothetical protein
MGVIGRTIGGAVALLVGAVGVILTVAFAAALAVFTLLASVLLALLGLTWRMGQRRTATAGPVVIDARKVGHAWVAYGWDEPRS